MSGIKEKIDGLIEERAGWIFRRNIFCITAKYLLFYLLNYKNTIKLAREFEHRSADEIFSYMEDFVSKKVHVQGFENLPQSGAALIVCNHPTGIADGLIINKIVREKRQDSYFLANKDILRVLPQLEEMIAPVEWRSDKRTRTDSRDTLKFIRKASNENRIGIIFPSGRLAKRTGFVLKERPWMSSAAIIAKKYNLPVIPIHIKARNSFLFYLFDAIHPTLRDVTLFYETLNKNQFRFRVRIGKPISPDRLDEDPQNAIDELMVAVAALDPQNVNVPIGADNKTAGRKFGLAFSIDY